MSTRYAGGQHQRIALPILLATFVSGCVASSPPATSRVATDSTLQPSANAPLATSSATPAPTSSASGTATEVAASMSSIAAEDVVDAALAVIAAGTVRYEIETQPEGAPPAGPKGTGRGEVSFRQPRQFRIVNNAIPHIDKPATEVMTNGKRVYLREGADPWIAYEVNEESPSWDLLVRNYGEPRLILAPLLGATAARKLGTEMIDGDATSGVQVDIDPDLVLERLPSHLVEPWTQQLTHPRRADPDYSQDVEVWIAPDGRLLRMRSRIATQGAAFPVVVVTYDFTGIGEAINVTPDPDEEVLTIEEAQERNREPVSSASPSP